MHQAMLLILYSGSEQKEPPSSLGVSGNPFDTPTMSIALCVSSYGRPPRQQEPLCKADWVWFNLFEVLPKLDSTAPGQVAKGTAVRSITTHHDLSYPA